MRFRSGICLQVVLAGVLWGSTGPGPDPRMPIDKYCSFNKIHETISYDLETTVQVESQKVVYTLKHCSNHEQKQWIGDVKRYNEDGTVDQNSSTLIAHVFDTEMGLHLQFYNPELKGNRPPRAWMVRKSRDESLHQHSETASHAGPLRGRYQGSNNHSIYDLLNEATTLKVHNKVVKHIGYDTVLIEAHTEYGVVKVCISPELNYSCLKWEIIKGPNQFYRDGEFTNDGFTRLTAAYDAERIEQLDGQYVITQAKFNYKVANRDTVLSNYTHHYKLRNIDLDPDYEAMGAFRIDLPEGTEVTHEDIPGRKFCWAKGEFSPNMNDYLPKNLTGKPLPSFDGIKTVLGFEQSAGKRLLVCFSDKDQRPSRNCIMQLAKQVEQLKQEGITVVMIQASMVDETKLNAWVKENTIPFTVGMIQGDEEKTHVAWGVKSLPWLILTDQKHQVVAEGITLQELDDKLKTD